jgi:hypothetical protein
LILNENMLFLLKAQATLYDKIWPHFVYKNTFFSLVYYLVERTFATEKFWLYLLQDTPGMSKIYCRKKWIYSHTENLSPTLFHLPKRYGWLFLLLKKTAKMTLFQGFEISVNYLRHCCCMLCYKNFGWFQINNEKEFVSIASYLHRKNKILFWVWADTLQDKAAWFCYTAKSFSIYRLLNDKNTRFLLIITYLWLRLQDFPKFFGWLVS